MKQFLLIFTASILFVSCNSSQETAALVDTSAVTIDTVPTSDLNSSANQEIPKLDCSNNIRAYEFGRSMATSSMLGAGTLQRAIRDYENGLGLEAPFSADEPCVIAGYDDEMKGIPSPFNKDGRSWNSF